MKDTHIGEHKQAPLDIENQPSHKVLLEKRHWGTRRCYTKYRFALPEERLEKFHFLKQLPLAFFYCRLEDSFVIREQYVRVNGKIEVILAVQVIYRMFHVQGLLNSSGGTSARCATNKA
jgi:hypothetical protein